MIDLQQIARGNPVRKAWDVLHRVPGGKTVFSKLLGKAAPYTGTIDARVRELRRGFCRVEMADRRGVRNHLNSVHAISLMNLAEVATGVAMMYSIPDNTRGILTGLSIEYIKKARGTISAECNCKVPETSDRAEYEVDTQLKDNSGDIVARARARWLIGPK